MTNTGKQRHLFTKSTNKNPTVSDQCPCCKQETKKTLHLYKCNHTDIKKIFTVSIELLFQALCSNKIPMDVWLTMITGLAIATSTVTSQDHQWLQISGVRGATITDAFTKKTTIGWGDFLKGWISANGGHLMQDKYTTKYFDPKTLSGEFF